MDIGTIREWLPAVTTIAAVAMFFGRYREKISTLEKALTDSNTAQRERYHEFEQMIERTFAGMNQRIEGMVDKIERITEGAVLARDNAAEIVRLRERYHELATATTTAVMKIDSLEKRVFGPRPGSTPPLGSNIPLDSDDEDEG